MMRPREIFLTLMMAGGVLCSTSAWSADPTAGVLADLDLDVLTLEPATPAPAPAAVPPPAEPAAPAPAPAADGLTGLDDLLAPAPPVTPEAPPVAEPPAATPPVAAEIDKAPVDLDSVVEGSTPDATVVEAVEPVAVEPPAVVDPNAVLVSEMKALEALRRQALEQHGFASLEQAKMALRKGNYTESLRLYEEALKFIPDRPGNDELRDEASRGVAESFYRDAMLLYKQGDLEKAGQVARVAREKGHPKATKLVAEIQHEIDNPPQDKPPRTPPRWGEDDYKKGREDATAKLTRARQYYATREYDKARATLEEILADHPYHTEAIEMMRKVQLKSYDVASREFQATHDGMITDVRETWLPRNYDIDNSNKWGTPPDTGGSSKKVEPDDTAAILKKMRDITIPEISFHNANIHDVIKFLQDQSRELDREDVPLEKRGVNLILNLMAGKSTADLGAPPADPNDPFAVDPVAVGGDSGTVPITFSARYISLFDALKIVMEYANLKYRIEGNIVMIVPEAAPESKVMHRWYNVLPTVLDRVRTLSTEIRGNRGGGGGGDFMEIEATDLGARGDWREFFGKMGVKWPAGSSISYMGSIGKLVVANTSENLTTLETILNVLNVTPSQIEIEARFVEVLQSDLESLGIEWLLTDNWELASHEDDANLPPEARRRVEVGANDATGGFTTGLRYLTDGVLGTFGGEAVADNVLQIATVLTNPEMTMVLHALSRKQDTDLLSAPKVTTKSGLEATIKVVTEYIYPTEFTVEGLETEIGDQRTTTTGAIVEPGGFQTREVGVILTCIPEVSPEGEIINLTLNPQVVSEPEWKNYGSQYTSGYTESGEPIINRLNMEQPFFPVRSVNTSISIYNGATVVMGGMITEGRVSVDDKVPLLGDIPIIGRLFRSRYERSEKRNLLIFVTARMVDPAGRSLSRNDSPTEIAKRQAMTDLLKGGVE